MLHPDFPNVEGRLQLTDDWALTLPERFNRRVEDGDLVIWRPGFTMLVAVWGNDNNETPRERLTWIREAASPEAYDLEESFQEDVMSLTYRLDEEADSARAPALYCYAVAEHGHVQTAFYFDDARDLALAKRIWRSLGQVRAP